MPRYLNSITCPRPAHAPATSIKTILYIESKVGKQFSLISVKSTKQAILLLDLDVATASGRLEFNSYYTSRLHVKLEKLHFNFLGFQKSLKYSYI